MHNQFPLLSLHEQTILQDALHYMKVAELKNASLMFGLSSKGKKAQLIRVIITYIKSGDILKIPKIPEISKANKYEIQQLIPSGLMLYGGYKNDLKTRNFFKHIIGPQFHFTAFGIDWLNERWLEGNPPTYQEFADFWIEETARRKREGTKPKDEWMFIRFMQKMEKEKPDATQEELLCAWKLLQEQKKNEALQLLKKALTFLK